MNDWIKCRDESDGTALQTHASKFKLCGLRTSTLPLGHGSPSQYWIFASERRRNILTIVDLPIINVYIMISLKWIYHDELVLNTVNKITSTGIFNRTGIYTVTFSASVLYVIKSKPLLFAEQEISTIRKHNQDRHQDRHLINLTKIARNITRITNDRCEIKTIHNSLSGCACWTMRAAHFLVLSFIYYSSGTVFLRQNLTSIDVRFWRIETVPAMKE